MASAKLKPGLKLEICAFFADEFLAALAAEERDDVELVLVHGACDERRHPSSPDMSSAEAPALRLMGVCSGGAANPKTLHSCFELLLGPDKVEALLGEGAHLLTPAMVRAYPETLQRLNEKPEHLQAYFAECVRAWVVVDAGVAPLTAEEQAAFLSATGGKMELLPTELHLLRANLRATLAQGEAAAIDFRSSQELASLQHRLADYTMAYDLISRLIPYQAEQTIVEAILELFYMLCAPHAVHLLLVQDGGEGAAQIFSLPADSGREDLLQAFLYSPTPQGETEVPRGFYFQIRREDAQPLGTVVVEGAFRPEHQRNYLDIAHLLMPILRLALHNARSYEKLRNTERELRASQMKLEQRVEERTRELRESEARFRNMLEHAPIGMAIAAPDGRFLQVNHALCAILGYEKAELETLNIREITHPEDLASTRANMQQLLAGERSVSQLEKRYLRKNGQAVWAQLTASIERDDSGAPQYFIGQIEDISERKQAEEVLRLHSAILENLVEGICLVRASDGVFVYANPQFERMFGYESGELSGKHVSIVNAPGEKSPEQVASEIIGELVRVGMWNGEVRNVKKDGTVFWCHASVTTFDHPKFGSVWVVVHEDISERKRAEDALRSSESRYRLLVENAPMCIHEIDMDGRISSMNRAGLLMMGVEQEGAVQGFLYLDAVCDADRERIGKLLAKAYTGEASHFEFKASGETGLIFKSCFVPIRSQDGGVEKLMGITEDITARKQAEEKIRNLASHDALTQLPNRRMLNDRLGQAMAANKRSGRYGAVMFLDLDNFKPLNDEHGHDVGDLLLIEVAYRLVGCVREADTVARFGGDEFVVMLGELDIDKEKSAREASMVAEKIRLALSKPYLLAMTQDGKAITVEHHCTSSIGVALFSNHEAGPEDILRRADMAMYQAKERGRNSFWFYDPEA